MGGKICSKTDVKPKINLFPEIIHGTVVVKYLSSTTKQIPRDHAYQFRISSAPKSNSGVAVT